MSEALHAAAARALERAGIERTSAEISRLTVDVAIDGRSEIVTLSIRDGELAWTSTGAPDGAHVHAAIGWLAGSASGAPSSVRRAKSPPSGEMAGVSWPPPGPGGAEEAESEALSARARLAEALEDVVTVLVRAGTHTSDSPSVSESLERLGREAPLPTPPGLGRWLGRLREALDAKDVGQVARLLDGAGQLADDLRRDRPSAAVRRRVAGWLGGAEPGSVERISDRVFIEVAREQLSSGERGGIERRYLVDVHNGEVFREERTRHTPVASVGPCPRTIGAGLAEVEQGSSPRRIRLMQYTVSLELDPANLRRIRETGYQQLGPLADKYREAMLEHPGQAEPFAIVAPARFRQDGPVAYDADDEPLPIARADDPAAVEALARLSEREPRWIAGRLIDVDGALMMVPCSVGVADADETRIHRLR